MLNVKTRKNIIDNIAKSIRINFKNINDLDSYIEEKIEDEYYDFKLNSGKYQRGIIYDKRFNSKNDNDISVVFDDFIGKSDKLNVYNSCENAELPGNFNKSVNYLNKIFYKKTLYNINCFIGNLFNFDRKKIILFFTLFFNYLLSVLYNLFILIIFTTLNILNYLIFLLFKFCLSFKYKIFRKFHLSLLNILLVIPIELLRFLLISIKEFANLLANIFNITNKVLNVTGKIFKNNMYSNIIASKVNRDKRSNEHKNVLNEINEKADKIFREYNKENTKYFDHFKFTKVSKEPLLSSNMRNKAFKEYLSTLERIEIKKITKKIKNKIDKEIKKQIYKKELPLKLEIIRNKQSQISKCEKISNKYLQQVLSITANVKDNFIQNTEEIEVGR